MLDWTSSNQFVSKGNILCYNIFSIFKNKSPEFEFFLLLFSGFF